MENVKCVITLESGKKINLELYPSVAPISVMRFMELASNGFFEGVCFHRVIPGFMIQGGGFVASDKKLTDKEGKASPIKGEFRSNGVSNDLKHSAGVISMARTSVKDSATCQFFITVADVHFLDGEYAAFGKTTDAASLQTAIEISKVPTATVSGHSDVPLKPVVIKKVEILG